jgi:hypothetical protein
VHDCAGEGGFVGWEVDADVCALVVDFGGVGEAGLGEGHFLRFGVWIKLCFIDRT